MNKLTPYLEQYNLSLKDIAEICNTSIQTVRRWDETGIINKKDHRNTLKEIIPEFIPSKRQWNHIKLKETNLKPPKIEKERKSNFPKVKFVKK